MSSESVDPAMARADLEVHRRRAAEARAAAEAARAAAEAARAAAAAERAAQRDEQAAPAAPAEAEAPTDPTSDNPAGSDNPD
jgi:type II secretory pathway pseudopilin PulG